MSQVYSTEPQTAGRVIFETTHGPLDIQLWSRECPSITKFFLQLCLDGYYENLLFHRIVPNFLVQTGALRYDPTASKKSSQKTQVTSLSHKDWRDYRERTQAQQSLERRLYELNTRIRFNHRGQVAMALPVDSDAIGDDEIALMQPQFFITLDGATELDGKHVCFGTVTGPTIFNALRIGNTDVDEGTGEPTILEEAPRIERVKIIENPIHSDLLPSKGSMPWKMMGVKGEGGSSSTKDKKKRKAIKNVNVLSFGDEMEQDLDIQGRGMKSSHDLVESKRLSRKIDTKVLEAVTKINDDDAPKKDIRSESPKPKKTKSTENVVNDTITTDTSHVSVVDKEPASSISPAIVYTTRSERKEDPPLRSKEQVETLPSKENKVPKISLVEARRAKYAKLKTKDKKQREEDTMVKFASFQSKIITKKDKPIHTDTDGDDGIVSRMVRRSETVDNADEEEDAPGMNGVMYYGQVLENDNDATDDWIKTKFQCRKHQDLDAKLGGDGRDALEDYKVIDEKDHHHSRRGDRAIDNKQHRRHRHDSKKNESTRVHRKG